MIKPSNHTSQRDRGSVSGIVLDDTKTKVLLIKRRDVPIWVLPGGGIDRGETSKAAVVREVQEETGLDVRIVRQVAAYSPINQLAMDVAVFECEPVSGQLTTGAETADIGFFSFTELPTPFFFIHKDWLDDANKNLPILIKKKLDKVTYFNLFKYFCKHPHHVMRIILSRLGIPLNK